jgi:hypothetical protein
MVTLKAIESELNFSPAGLAKPMTIKLVFVAFLLS